jgi:hypothetical protein
MYHPGANTKGINVKNNLLDAAYIIGMFTLVIWMIDEMGRFAAF